MFFRPDSDEKRTVRLAGADNVRALAMLAIFCVHAITILLHEEPRWLMEVCRTGTDLFFLLTGCLIYRSVVGKTCSYREFLLRRIRRIFPVYLFVLGLYLFVLYPLWPNASRIPPSFGEAAMVVAGNATLLPLALGVRPIITVSWSLGYICGFYVVAYPIIRRTECWPRAFRVGFWLLLTFDTFVLCGRAALIPLGVLLSELIACGPPPRWALLLSVCCAGRWIPKGTVPPDAPLLLAFAGAFAICWWMLPLTCSSWPARLLSQISYSFYLTHGLAITFVARLPFPPAVLLPLSLLLSFAVAATVYHFVEKHLSPIKPGFSLPRSISSRQERFEGHASSVPTV